MNPAAASAAVYSLVAILGLAVVLGLWFESRLAWLRTAVLESMNQLPPGRGRKTAPELFSNAPNEAVSRAVAAYLLPGRPGLWFRWISRGFPPLHTLPDAAEIRSVLSAL